MRQENIAQMLVVRRAAALEARDRAVIAWLPYRQPGATVRELVDLTGLHIGAVRQTLKRLEDARRVSRQASCVDWPYELRRVTRWAIIRR